ncbi:hypothetical protein NC651_027165 [Populus alba x Populus x berolinensis]|nr:hypothetical protein NC651_027165 [Populus alba x Populus x berolinensis]
MWAADGTDHGIYCIFNWKAKMVRKDGLG